MSRTSRIDRHALQDTHPRHRLAEREQTPDVRLRRIAERIEVRDPQSTTAREDADFLRACAKVVRQWIEADQKARRADAEALFRRQR